MLMQPGPNATTTPKCLQTEALCRIREPLFDYCYQGILQYRRLLIFCGSICWLPCIGIGALTVSYFCQSDDGPLQVSRSPATILLRSKTRPSRWVSSNADAPRKRGTIRLVRMSGESPVRINPSLLRKPRRCHRRTHHRSSNYMSRLPMNLLLTGLVDV